MPFPMEKVLKKPLQFKFPLIFLTLFTVLVASIVPYSSSVGTGFSNFLPLVVRKLEQGSWSSWIMSQVVRYLDYLDAQRGEGNAQIGGGGHNPQVQGNINAGSGGSINLGLQGVNLGLQDKKDSPQDNKDSPQDNKDTPQGNKDKKGNAQIGGGGHNPQVQGNINAGSGGNINLGLQDVNLGLQDRKDSPQDNKDNPQDNKDSPQDTPQGNKDKKGNTQIGGGGHNPQVQGNINAGSGGNINLGLQGASFDLRKSSANMGNQGYGGGNANTETQE